MAKLREIIVASEDVGLRLRYVIAGFVENDFGSEERACYLGAVFDGKATSRRDAGRVSKNVSCVLSVDAQALFHRLALVPNLHVESRQPLMIAVVRASFTVPCINEPGIGGIQTGRGSFIPALLSEVTPIG